MSQNVTNLVQPTNYIIYTTFFENTTLLFLKSTNIREFIKHTTHNKELLKYERRQNDDKSEDSVT